MAVIGKLSVLLGLNNTQFKAGMAQSGAQVRRFKGQTQGAAAMVDKLGVAALATTAIMAKFRAAMKIGRAAEEFNQALASSMAIMGDVSDVMRDKMIKTAHDVAFETKFSAKETAAAFFDLTSAGYDVEQSLAAMPRVAKFAQAGMFDLSTATALATRAQGAMGLIMDDSAENMRELTRVTDVLVMANKLSMATVEQFAEALAGGAGVAANQLNMSLEETVAVLAVFAKKGVPAAELSTKFSIAMRELSNKAIINSSAFEKAGVSVWDAGGKFRGVAAIIENLDTVMSKLSARGQTSLLLDLGFTAKSVGALKTLLGTSGQITEWFGEVKNAGGTVDEVSSKQLTPFGKAWGRVKDAMAQVLFPPFTRLLGELGILLESVAQTVRFFGKALGWVKSILSKVVRSVIALWEALKSKLKASLDRVSEATSRLKAAASRLWDAIKGLGATFSHMITKTGILESVANLATIALERLVLPSIEGFLNTLVVLIDAAARSLEYFADVAERFNGRFGPVMQDAADEVNSLAEATSRVELTEMALKQAGAMEAVEKATKAAGKIQDTLFSKGASLAAGLATPFEKLQSRIKDANSLLSVGAITWKTYGREVSAVRKELMELQAVGDTRPEAAGRNSQAFFAALSRQRTAGRFARLPNQGIDSLVQTEQPEGSNQVVEEAKASNLLLADQVRLLNALKAAAEEQNRLLALTVDTTGQLYDVYPETEI